MRLNALAHPRHVLYIELKEPISVKDWVSDEIFNFWQTLIPLFIRMMCSMEYDQIALFTQDFGRQIFMPFGRHTLKSRLDMVFKGASNTSRPELDT